MTDTIHNVLIELGEPLRWGSARLGAGLTIAEPDDQGAQIVVRPGAAGTTTAIVGKKLVGSWVSVVEVDSLPSGAVAVGARGADRRKTLRQSRLVNSPRDHDRPAGASTRGYAVTSDGQRYTNGSLASTGLTFGAGTRLVIRYNAVAQLLSITNGTTGTVYATWSDVFGPWEIIGMPGGAGSSLRLLGDVDHVPWDAIHRPAGVWGRVALYGVTTPHADPLLRDTYFDGRIDGTAPPTYAMEASIPLIDGSRPARAVGDIRLLNADRGIDHWLDWATRDEQVSIRVGSLDTTYSDCAVVATARIDDLSPDGSNGDRLVITPRDAAALLDLPWQAEQYPSTASVEALRNTTKPTAIGDCRCVPLVITDASNLLYDIADDALWAVSAVYDRAVPLTLGTGYSVNADRAGVKRLTNPAGKQVADVIGRVTDSTVYVDAVLGDFAPWAGSPAVPAGWDRGFTGAGCSVTNASPGARFQAPTGGAFASLHVAGLFAAQAMNLRIDITMSARTSGTLNIRLTDFGANFIDTQISAVGTYSFFVSKPPAALHLQVFTNFAAADITVSRLRISRVEAMDTLSPWLRHLACERGPLRPDQLDIASIASVAGDRPWPLCLYTGQGSNLRVIDVLDQTVRSIAGGWYVDPLGTLCLMTLDGEKGEPVATFTDTEIIGDISRELIAPGDLSDRVAGQPIWSPSGDGDIADSVLTTTAGRARADLFRRDYGITKKGAWPLASVYDAAANAEPIETLLATDAGVQGLANTVTTWMSVPKHLYQFTGVPDAGIELRPGQRIVLQTNQYDLADGKTLRIIGVTGEYGENVVQIKAVG